MKVTCTNIHSQWMGILQMKEQTWLSWSPWTIIQGHRSRHLRPQGQRRRLIQCWLHYRGDLPQSLSGFWAMNELLFVRASSELDHFGYLKCLVYNIGWTMILLQALIRAHNLLAKGTSEPLSNRAMGPTCLLEGAPPAPLTTGLRSLRGVRNKINFHIDFHIQLVLCHL